MKVYRSEIHIIRKGHELYKYCDEICFKSKNLYNYANFLMRKEFLDNHKFLFPFSLNKVIKHDAPYLALPALSSAMTVIKLGNNWNSYFRSIKDWSKNKNKYQGMPKLPKYKDKNGRFVAYFDQSQIKIKNGLLYFQEGRGIKAFRTINTNVKKETLRQIQIIPEGGCYKISIIYYKEITENINKNNSYLAIDLGINNLATLTNNIGLNPIIINGRPLKSMNNYYNKKLSIAMSFVGTGKSNKISKLSDKRNNIIENYLHKVSRKIIEYCLNNNINNIIIGHNKDWQRNSNIGKKNNQVFSQIPFEPLIYKIKYKAEENSINVILVEEQYTSKSSFIDNDAIPELFGEYEFSGKRVKRGLYKSKYGLLINSDVNGSYNILRKCIPEFIYKDEIKGVALHPFRINI